MSVENSTLLKEFATIPEQEKYVVANKGYIYHFTISSSVNEAKRLFLGWYKLGPNKDNFIYMEWMESFSDEEIEAEFAKASVQIYKFVLKPIALQMLDGKIVMGDGYGEFMKRRMGS